MYRITVIVLLFAFCVCGYDEINNEVDEEYLVLPDYFHQLEIVNGTAADEGEFPFAVSSQKKIFFKKRFFLYMSIGVFEVQQWTFMWWDDFKCKSYINSSSLRL